MLPPFVPPSARKANDRLPSINDFVVEPQTKPVEQAVAAPLAAGIQNAITGSSSDETPLVGPPGIPGVGGGSESREIESGSGETVGEVVAGFASRAPEASDACNVVRPVIEYSNSLPSIEEFVARAPYVATAPEAVSGVSVNESEFVQIGLSSRIESEVQAEPQVVEHPVTAIKTEGDTTIVTPQGGAVPATDATASNDWVDAERDSFDWQSVANLATPPAETLLDDEQRAADAWMSTDWSTPSSSPTEHIASVLLQLARRVRSGELEVDAPRGTSTEAAVAAVLTALLSQPNGFGDR